MCRFNILKQFFCNSFSALVFQTFPQRHGDRDAAGGSPADTAAAEVVLFSYLLCSQRVSVLAHLPALVSTYSVQTQAIVQEFCKSNHKPPGIHVFCAGHGRFGVVGAEKNWRVCLSLPFFGTEC